MRFTCLMMIYLMIYLIYLMIYLMMMMIHLPDDLSMDPFWSHALHAAGHGGRNKFLSSVCAVAYLGWDLFYLDKALGTGRCL